MAKIYATDFTEQELKDLLAFYKSPLGQKLLEQEPKSISGQPRTTCSTGRQLLARRSTTKFRDEMKKRGKDL